MEPLLTVNEIFSLSLTVHVPFYSLFFVFWVGFYHGMFVLRTIYNFIQNRKREKKTKNKSYFSHDLPTGFYDSCTLITYFRNVLAFFVSFVVSFCLLFLGFMFCVWICVNGTNIWKRAKSSAAHSESCIPHLPLTSLTVSTKMKRREKMKNKIL